MEFIYVIVRLARMKQKVAVKSVCSYETVHMCFVALISQLQNCCSGTSSLHKIEVNANWHQVSYVQELANPASLDCKTTSVWL